VRAWNLLSGLDWQGLELVAEMFGVRDVESWIDDIATLRDWHNRRAR
jgi:hypothetical protein